MCLKILFSLIHFTRCPFTHIFFLQKFERKMINDKTSQFLSQVIFNEHVQSLLLFSLMTKVKTEVLDRVVLTTDDPQDSPHPLQKHGEGDEQIQDALLPVVHPHHQLPAEAAAPLLSEGKGQSKVKAVFTFSPPQMFKYILNFISIKFFYPRTCVINKE